MANARCSVIIPTLDEASRIERTLARVLDGDPHEVIVSDGGSGDGTVELARRAGARVVESRRGKGVQMNTGAAAATGEVLLFLHADTLPPEGYVALMLTTLCEPGVVAGAFRFSVDRNGRAFRRLTNYVNWRSRARQLPFGDQGLFMRAATFEKVGRYPEQPVMEDYELIRRLRRLGRIALADAACVTSARRWSHSGLVRNSIVNRGCVIAYHLGVSPQRLDVWRRRLCPSR